MTNDSDDRVRALVRLDRVRRCLSLCRPVYRAAGAERIGETQRAAAQYEQLEGQRSGFQITFALIFILVAMLFLVGGGPDRGSFRRRSWRGRSAA